MHTYFYYVPACKECIQQGTACHECIEPNCIAVEAQHIIEICLRLVGVYGRKFPDVYTQQQEEQDTGKRSYTFLLLYQQAGKHQNDTYYCCSNDCFHIN